jgi:CRISPR/Cas system CMR-associated protein Cmr5 small subunit
MNVLSAIKNNKFNNKMSKQKDFINFLSNHLKLHQVIQNNYDKLFKNFKDKDQIIYRAKSYFIFKLNQIIKKFIKTSFE